MGIGVAAVVDDGVNATAFLLPGDDISRGEGTLASTVPGLERVSGWEEPAKPGFVG